VSADDLAVLAELESRPLELPAGLQVEWLGVSGYRLAYEGRSLYVDPYFSRVPLRSLLLRRTAVPHPPTLDRYLPAADEAVGVLVGHTHFDHAVDAPAVARRFGCPAYGSSSLVHLMGLHGLADRAVEVEPHRPYELGPFTVTFVPSAHSKLILGFKVPYAGELTCDHLDGLCPSAYKCGQVWGIQIEVAGITLYHQGSAELDDDELGRRRVDVFLAGIAGRNFSRDYWNRILPRLDPAVVVPTHYDDFFRPLEGDLALVTGAKLDQLEDELAAVSGDLRLTALPRLAGRPTETF
jgi:L-ascorbate metabolism protein UlaG (beta-lactamase superfamily)